MKTMTYAVIGLFLLAMTAAMSGCDSHAVIEAHGLHRIYETAAGLTHALRGVSLSVGKGEFLCIMGPSGSGKSTLMNILGCLDTPTTIEDRKSVV